MTAPKSQNITRIALKVERDTREQLNGHKGVTLWFTGLSASGKSTVATMVDQMLTERGIHCYVLDGDNLRHGLNRDLGFSAKDRAENVRRVGEVARLFTQAGLVVLTAFISPYRNDRDVNRAIQEKDDFIEVFVDCPLDVCESRDPKGLYEKARNGEIKDFTGISAPYEPPISPEIVLRTAEEAPDKSAERIIAYLLERGYLSTASKDS